MLLRHNCQWTRRLGAPTPDHSGQVIFDALTADAAVLGGVFFGATIS